SEWSNQPRLEVGKYNVNPNSNLDGKSPQQWLEDMAKKDFNEKTLRYQLAMMKNRIPNYSKEFWPKSYEEFQKALDTVLAEDSEAVYIVSYPVALGSEYIPFNLKPVVPMYGQIAPYYSVLLARAFGRAAFVVTDLYPDFGAHSEPYVVISQELHNKLSQSGELLLPYTFGGWLYKGALREDHQTKPRKPWVTTPDGTIEEIKL
ncbi:hypothetical protein KEJ47_09015, partial [Candidatus Bathyarchaeota archaeon]|nr:hypothetical protein [Candidatus Bathyarchaeota archaeon]